MDDRPSKKQYELLQFIEGFIKGNGYGPSYREVMRALGYKSVSTVAIHIDGLIARGLLRKRDRSARSLEVVGNDSGKPVDKMSTTHSDWLMGVIEKRMAGYHDKPTSKKLHDIRVLIETLGVLGYHEQMSEMQLKYDQLIKQLDQTTH